MIRLLFIASILFSLSFSARAELISSVTCGANGIVLRGTTSCTQGSAVATATAGYGVLKAAASGAAPSSGGASAQANAKFDDDVTINAAGLKGTIGTATTTLSYHYDLTAVRSGPESSAEARALLQFATSTIGLAKTDIIQVGEDAFGAYTHELHALNINNQQVSIDAPLTLTWNFVFGTPFKIQGTLDVGGGGANSGAGRADAAHSAYWGGLTIIAPGLTEYVVTSASGTDWNQSFAPAVISIPEPSTILLMLLGLSFISYASSVRRGRR